MTAESERLRRALYARGATAEDVEAYRRQLPAPVVMETRAAIPRRRRLPFAVAVAIGLLVLSVAVVSALAPHRAARPVAEASPIAVSSSALALTADGRVQGWIGQAFAGGTPGDDAAGDLIRRVRRAALPDAGAPAFGVQARGTSGPGLAVSYVRPFRLPAGSTLLLTVASRAPVVTRWTVTGYPGTAESAPTTLAVARTTPGTIDRLGVAAVRLPVAAVVTGITLQLERRTQVVTWIERYP